MKKFVLFLLCLLTFQTGCFAGELKLQDDSVNEALISPYINEVERIVKINWDKPDFDNRASLSSDKTVVVIFKVMRDGNIKDLAVKTSSGDSKLDSSVVSAVTNSTPFKPLPEGFYGHYIEVEMTFESKLLRKEYISPVFM